MSLAELSPEEIERNQERRLQTEQNISFLQGVLGIGRRRARTLHSPTGTEIFICDGRYMQEKDSEHLREQLHVLSNCVSGPKCYSIYPGRLDVWTIANGKLRRTVTSPQDPNYHTIVSAVTLGVRLCLPPRARQLPLPVDNL